METTLLHGDCMELMRDIPDKSIDMVLCDLPYGLTHCDWDRALPLEALWKEYRRIVKENGAVLLFSIQPYTTDLISSNRKMFRYELIWDKVQKTGFLNAKRMPLRRHEQILVFYRKLPTYNPQMKLCMPHEKNHSRGSLKGSHKTECYAEYIEVPTKDTDKKYPTSIITVPKEHKTGQMYIPTQKPVALMEYLIQTYSNEGDTVLDNCMGSGTTGIACVNTGRRFIGIEMHDEHFQIAQKRIGETVRKKEECTNVFIAGG